MASKSQIQPIIFNWLTLRITIVQINAKIKPHYYKEKEKLKYFNYEAHSAMANLNDYF